MVRPLLFLSALIELACAQQIITPSSVLNISSCPITYYGKKYEQLYVTITTENFALCFDGFFKTQTGGDCLVGPTASYVTLHIDSRNSKLESQVHQEVPSIKASMECSLEFFMEYTNTTSADLYLLSFGKQAALFVFTDVTTKVDFEVHIGGIKVTTVYKNTVQDISGCRHSGTAYEPDTVVSSNPDTCSILTCSETAVLETLGCGPLERCQGNNTCVVDTTCTVTGPTVINVHGQVNSIKDRCAYSLVSIPSIPNFYLMANFRDRRREDVSFLDSVILHLDGPGVHSHLEQGGTVWLDDSTLTLSSSPQLVHGVQLSKDQTGVTAKLSLSNLTISVFFDGDTAQIRLEGPAGSSVEGLCGNSSRSLSDLRLSEYSSTSCEMQYSEPADSTINCTSVTERCNLLKEAPFSSCNSDIDPEPYITACTDTLCKYPAVDGLNCQFLKAYARACSLHNHTLDGWTLKTGCSSEAFCQDRTCSDHEFCGEKTVSGDTRCFCRAIFASKYQANNSLGDPTVCMQDSASLTLVGCLLEDKGIDYSTLHLNDPTCRGQMDELTHMVTFSFNSSNRCGTVVTANNSYIVYQNTIRSQNYSSDVISRHDQVQINFSCVHSQPNINTATFRIRDCSVAQKISCGVWNYTLIIKAYTDAGQTQVVQLNSEVRLNQRIWVELETNGLDGSMVTVVSDSCWATDQASPTSSPRHDLIINGCANPADPTVAVEENGLGTSSLFSFNMFRFIGGSGEVYLHCKLHLCPKEDTSCTPNCNAAARRHRSVGSKYEGEASISMSWTH
ncbi:alpha-tectorin-like isoform X1 [Oreochromis aureus]|uniref:ZP domain-containing protein n=1 Tax=Oreochromis aureus TaxID=47969 RepID=A0AAZ1XP97_OREAU|nr:alpha-tectorin-like isoform X1 [Oreochromis aureus]